MSSTGSTESHRVRTHLTIQVAKVEFSPAAASGQQEGGANADPSNAAGPSAALHISGPVIQENQHVRMGAYHTLDIEPNRDVRIEKAEGWDSIARARVEEAIVPGRGAEVAALVCGEGTAAFCLLSQHMTIVPHRISMSIPRKAATAGTSQHEKGMGKFFATLYDGFLRHIPYGNPGLRAIVLASPGWIRDSVFDYIMAEAVKRGDKTLQKALKEKTIKVHVNSPHVHSLVEVLKSPEVRPERLQCMLSDSHALVRSPINSKKPNLRKRVLLWIGECRHHREYSPAYSRIASSRCLVPTRTGRGMVLIMCDWRLSEEQLEHCLSPMISSARVTQRLGKSTLRWWKRFSQKEEKSSSSRVCTSPGNVSPGHSAGFRCLFTFVTHRTQPNHWNCGDTDIPSRH